MTPEELTTQQEEKLEEDFLNYLYTYLQWGKGGESMDEIPLIKNAYRYIYLQGMKAAKSP